MSVYPILIHPDKRLRKIAKPVETFTPELKTIVENLFETMYAARGIGLAATQVDIHQRIIVMDVPREMAEDSPEPPEHDKLVLINPELLTTSAQTKDHEEGCLSIPEQYASVSRPAEIRLRWQDPDGNTHEQDMDGLLAVCVQHEMDHLNGIVFVDHISRLKRERIEKKLAKLQKTHD